MKHVRALLGATALPPGVIFMAATSIEDLKAKILELEASSQAIVDEANEEERDISDEEIETIEANKAEALKFSKQIAAREAAKPLTAGPGG